ncbi:GSCOCG00010448001-RA-CDS [Cotesia congregata]|nr:GSCOCG00010448001-RA-CDS [Cotesia congregata]
MDDLFGKDDSFHDSDAVKKSNYLSNDDKLDDFIEIEEHDIKPEVDKSLLSKGTDSNLNPIINSLEINSGDKNEIINLDHINSSSSTNTNNNNDDEDIMNISNKDDDLFSQAICLPPPQARPMEIKDRRESKDKNKRELEEEEREKMQVLVSNFTEDQLDRYEMFRRAAFPKAAIKRIMQTITGCSVSQNVVIAMSGIAKVFVGEIVEKALDVMEEYNDSGPVQPKHLREAVRRLRLQGQIPIGRSRKTFLRL